ncbi:hypothetical protein L1D22_17910 [Vibrio sp. Isolate34]|uniref:hypothetical protein n=1 Tax=Vibrio sp. Isolate34 TaxID=2908540 RepID=UPI001EFD6D0B|nr:hypothetical protein [Vibrio sp. Isolate34]MCG9641733.1 hypothetical protein [Vibrio sp. Isolate34]
MNINDFLLTASISALIGGLLGYFLRDAVEFGVRVYQRYFTRSQYFEQDVIITKNKKLK